MPLVISAAMPTARMQTLYAMSAYKDVAVLDFSTNGHGVYNNGHLPWIIPNDDNGNIFSTHITEVDISLGDQSRLFRAAEELKNAGYKNIYLMPSSLANVLGFDLRALAAEMSDRFDVNAFTIPSRLNDDFYAGMSALYLTLASNSESDKSTRKEGFNLLGGIVGRDERNHAYISALIERELGLKPNFDSLAADKLSDWNRFAKAEINVVTSEFALKTAQFAEKNFSVPYVYARPLGKTSEDNALVEIAKALGKNYDKTSDSVYGRALIRIKNILEFNKPKISCYADTDILRSLKSLFDEIGYGADYFCTHKGGDFPYVVADKFIEENKNNFVLSNDRICSFCAQSLEVEGSGLDYRFTVPLPDAYVGKEGAYRIMKSLALKLINK